MIAGGYIMNGALTIKSLAELELGHVRQAAEIFVESYYQSLSFLSEHPNTIVDAIVHSFIRERYYAGVLDDNVVGIVACSTKEGRSHRFDPKEFILRFGLFKGYIGYRRLRSSLEKPLELNSGQCYIESVATDTAFRGIGISTQLQQHLLEHLEFDEFILEVEPENYVAVQLYEKLGFSIIESQTESKGNRFGKGPSRVMMHKIIPK